MADSTYPLFPIFAFLGFVLSLIPLPWHLQAWNSGTCYYMIWTALSCLNQFINSIVWHGNAFNPAPVWCDISTRILLGAAVGIPASSVCIMRRLYHISSVHKVTITRSEKRRAVIVDTLICVLFPMIFIAIQFFIQGHRFNIFEDIGCYPAITNSIPTYFLSNIWPIILGLISAVYCILTLRAFWFRRSQFSEYLSSNKSLTASRYFRLMALAMAEMFCTTPLATFVIWLNATAQPIVPWRGLADAHFAFSRVDQVPAVVWRQDHLIVVSMELTRWIAPVCAIIFFAFFGFAEEARKHYRILFWAIVKPFGLSPPLAQSSAHSSSTGYSARKLKPLAMASLGSLPLYTPTTTTSATDSKRPDSLASSLPQSASIPKFIDIRRQSYSVTVSTEQPTMSLPSSPSVSCRTEDTAHYRDSMPVSPSDTVIGSDAGHLPFPSPRAI